jgi:hypothetical protein
MEYTHPALVRRWTRGIGVPLDPLVQFKIQTENLSHAC